MRKTSLESLKGPRFSPDVQNKSHVVLLQKHLLQEVMKLVYIHKAIIFKQEAWLRSYIIKAVN